MPHSLVTGGAGFIGSNIVHALVERGDKVRVLDNLATGREANIAELVAAGKVEFIRGDITDKALVARAVQGIDYVFHQAAIPSVPRSIEDPVNCDLANVHGTVVVLDAAHKAKCKRVVFAASSSAYGEKAPGEAKVETMMPDPLSPYAVAKLACENYLRVFHHVHGLETVGLRYFNVFGPRQDPKSQYAAVIPNFVGAALRNEPATVYGDGKQSRDFCFIENVVEANLLACTAKDAPGEIINVACGEAVDLIAVLDIIAKETGNRVPAKFLPARTGDIKHSLADIGKAKRILGYQGRVKFQEGVARTIAWYRAQKAA